MLNSKQQKNNRGPGSLPLRDSTTGFTGIEVINEYRLRATVAAKGKTFGIELTETWTMKIWLALVSLSFLHAGSQV